MQLTIDIPDKSIDRVAHDFREIYAGNEPIEIYRLAVAEALRSVVFAISGDLFDAIEKYGRFDIALRRARRNNPPLTQAAILSEKD
jgi:hypothetical protein